MIDPKELRIGNTIKLNIGEGKLTTVDWKALRDISENYEQDYKHAGLPMYVPVGIDGEVLFQLGFEWDTESPFIFQKDKILLKRRRNGFFIMINNSKPYHKKPVNYLHQLQNVYYALFGEELIFLSK